LSVLFLRRKPADEPVELPRMSNLMGAVNPLAHLHAEWLGVDPGKTNMATVAHEERSAVAHEERSAASQGLDVLNKQQHQVSNGLTLHMCMAATYPT
ncbi:hypothetical protein, partial [Phenylobacterium sp.]|uniref:hypothetical protein n=1 Tax=Phenylobacterium sp. TaxID=1871053 RepID=UPI0040360F33